LAGAAGALLLQAAFLFLFLYSMPEIRPVETAREMVFVFHRALAPPPPLPAPAPQLTTPEPVPAMPSPLFAPPALSAPPSFAVPDLRGFGDMLNNCAPEIYSQLTPEKRALCPHPGGEAGIPGDDTGIEIAPRSHSKDAATWQEEWDEKHWVAGLCDPSMGLVALCQMHQAIAEHERAEDVRDHLRRAKTEALKQPPPQLPDSAREKN
jgi:hypothetical protein